MTSEVSNSESTISTSISAGSPHQEGAVWNSEVGSIFFSTLSRGVSRFEALNVSLAILVTASTISILAVLPHKHRTFESSSINLVTEISPLRAKGGSLTPRVCHN
jgi:hypothetical protein